jgi:hypothetical protein
VAQVNDFGALRLQNAAHNIDGGIVSVEQTGSSNYSDFRLEISHGRQQHFNRRAKIKHPACHRFMMRWPTGCL